MKSFWIACAGLAIMAHISSATVNAVITNYDSWIAESLFDYDLSYQAWITVQGLQMVAGVLLTPSLVIACLVPILFWRGPLLTRFAISSLVFLTTALGVGRWLRWCGWRLAHTNSAGL